MKHIGNHYQMRPLKTTSIFSSKFRIKVTSILDVFVYHYAQDCGLKFFLVFCKSCEIWLVSWIGEIIQISGRTNLRESKQVGINSNFLQNTARKP